MIIAGRGRSPLSRFLLRLAGIDWLLAFLLCLLAGVSGVMLYSVAGGALDPWARAQMLRFLVCFMLMLAMALAPLSLWRNLSWPAYAAVIVLLLAVLFSGTRAMGAQRWLDLGFVRLQPSEFMKIALLLVLAHYYSAIAPEKASRPLYILFPLLIIALPAWLVLRQPDLGTTVLIVAGGLTVMYLAGVAWVFFATILALLAGGVGTLFALRGSEWQILKDYQWRRIDTFLSPDSAPEAAGYHITQSRIAFGSGGLLGRGYLNGSQSRLDFLPEKHTDFIFTSLAEEFGLAGSAALLGLYFLVLTLLLLIFLRAEDRFAKLIAGGVGMVLFLHLAVNMAMVTGLIPIVGVPLPLISHGGTSMVALMIGFGLVQSVNVYRKAETGADISLASEWKP